MFSKLEKHLSFTNALLVAGIFLGVCSEYFSVIGFAKIFNGLYAPFIALGIAKFAISIYLHTSWTVINKAFRTYIVAAVGVLILLTSIGIFGYLSDSSAKTTQESDSNNAKIGFIADKIKTKEADLVVENANYDLVKVPLNRKMEAKKTLVSTKIDTIKAEILELKEEKFSVESVGREGQTKIGSLVYISNIIYGTSDNKSIERSVKMVIFLVMFVFDPLAIVLLIAYHQRASEVKVKRVYKKRAAKTVDTEVVTKPKRKYVRKQKPVESETNEPNLSQEGI